MPYAHHSDPAAKWRQQYQVTRNHIIPFIQNAHSLKPDSKILEIGCGEGGVLKAFTDQGFRCYGIDITAGRIEQAKRFFKKEIDDGLVSFYTSDIHDSKSLDFVRGQIDLIILKDTIEHIFDQVRILRALHQYLKQGGALFFAFPPWYNPFGGHQQLADSFLRYVPWFHMLPRSLYQKVLQLGGESEARVNVLLDIYDTRLSIAKFEKLLRMTGWSILARRFYLFNPIYEYKFGIKGRRQFRWLARLPFVRDFLSTGVYYLVT